MRRHKCSERNRKLLSMDTIMSQKYLKCFWRIVIILNVPSFHLFIPYCCAHLSSAEAVCMSGSSSANAGLTRSSAARRHRCSSERTRSGTGNSRGTSAQDRARARTLSDTHSGINEQGRTQLSWCSNTGTVASLSKSSFCRINYLLKPFTT